VRNAGSKQATKRSANDNTSSASNMATGNLIAGGSTNTNPDYNDCEIIVVDRKNTKYAEFIEERLKRLKLRVDVLFPNEDVPLGKVLSNISSRGCLYAVLVTNQHEELNSITVNILYGQPAEHRNMPVEDAIKLISDDFYQKLTRDAAQKPAIVHGNNLPKSMPIIPAASLVAPPLKERHPQAIQILLNALADNMPLTVLQYDRIIKYLQERRELQMKMELGDADDLAGRIPDPEIELQKKILSILNKPSVAETHYNLLYPTLDAVKEDYRILELLKDVRVQKALESLMDSNLVSTVENYMKF